MYKYTKLLNSINGKLKFDTFCMEKLKELQTNKLDFVDCAFNFESINMEIHI
jgi:hypothetical protein